MTPSVVGLLGLLLACGGDDGPGDGTAADGGAQDGGAQDGGGTGGSDGGGTGDGGGAGDGGAPDLEVDVLVIGSGAAGMSAAWEADQAGASVLVVERDAQAGGAGLYARHFIAAGTRWQAEAGIEDTPDRFLLEWPTFTNGGDPEDPWVQALAFESAGVLDWLVDELGCQFEFMMVDAASGTTMRVHSVGYGQYGAVQSMVELLGDRVWTGMEATALRFDPAEPSRVTGAWVQDLVTGETLQVAARATVVATGGFARDLDHVIEVRPELEGATLVYEARPGSDGGGRGLLAQAGAASQNEGNHGIYLHAVEDPRPTLAGEAVVLDRLDATVMVDQDGARVGNEALFSGFTLSDALAAAPGKRVWAIYPAVVFDSGVPMTMGVALGIAEEDPLTPATLLELGAAWRAADAVEIPAATGIDAAGLQATIERYRELVALGEDLDFGKRADALVPLSGELVVLELAGGSAKSFGGAWLDPQGRVLDPAGAPVPGLYSAGEAAGMLGTPAVADGFSGSVTACYLTGRVAGQSAAAEALKGSAAR